jgi:glutathione S-transferase
MNSTQPMSLIIGNYNYSSWSLRPWILLKHLDLPFETIRVLLDTPTFKAQVQKHSPAGRVPVLIHGSLSIWESIAIIEYLNEITKGAAYPSNPEQRAYARSLVAEMHAGFQAMRQAWPMNLRAKRTVATNPALIQDIHRIDAIFKDCRQQFKNQGPWLMGQYSAVDAMYLPIVMRFKTYGNASHLSPDSHQYVEQAASDPLFAPWLAQALAEKEVVDVDEAGQAVND